MPLISGSSANNSRHVYAGQPIVLERPDVTRAFSCIRAYNMDTHFIPVTAELLKLKLYCS